MVFYDIIITQKMENVKKGADLMEYSDIKKIIEDMGNSNLDNLEIEFPDGLKIKMEKDNKEKTVEKVLQPEKNEVKIEENYKLIKAPMVGTFYGSSSPKAEPFVKIGDKVKKGQVVCIVEAMKLMNEVESEFDGEIVEICKKDEEMVEYGEILFKIK